MKWDFSQCQKHSCPNIYKEIFNKKSIFVGIELTDGHQHRDYAVNLPCRGDFHGFLVLQPVFVNHAVGKAEGVDGIVIENNLRRVTPRHELEAFHREVE